ncbi:uncharacterized protein LOC144007897 [Festucalex cinctus]
MMRDDSTHQDDSKDEKLLGSTGKHEISARRCKYADATTLGAKRQLYKGYRVVRTWFGTRGTSENPNRQVGRGAGWKERLDKRIQIDGLRKRDDSMHQMKTPT